MFIPPVPQAPSQRGHADLSSQPKIALIRARLSPSFPKLNQGCQASTNALAPHLLSIPIVLL